MRLPINRVSDFIQPQNMSNLSFDFTVITEINGTAKLYDIHLSLFYEQ